MDEVLDLYRQASRWTNEKVAGAVGQLDAETPCDGWSVRTLMNHMLDTARFFTGSATGAETALPSPDPPELLGDDPVAAFDEARATMIEAYGAPGVIDRTGPSIGIAFTDQLLHGWDLARATGQDATMPEGLPDVALQMIHGRFTDEQRKGVFKPEVRVPADASPQDKLLAYTGRNPAA